MIARCIDRARNDILCETVGLLSLVITKAQMSQCARACVSRSVSVVLKSLGVWLHAILLFDSPFGFITSFKISKCGCDSSALRTLNFVRFGMLEY